MKRTSPPTPLLGGEGSQWSGRLRTGEYIRLIRERARSLRRNETNAERLFWKVVRDRQFSNLKFKRQHPIVFRRGEANYFYIVDFYCHQHRLVVELDGGIHDRRERIESDLIRSKVLEEMGYVIVRFRNEEVVDGIEEVKDRLLSIVLNLTPNPSPRRRGEPR